jgi:cytochrome P450
MLSFIDRLTLDALGDLGFKFNFNAIAEPDGEYVTLYNRIMADGMKAIYAVFPVLDKLPHRQGLLSDIEKFRGMLTTMIEKRRAEVKELKAKGKQPHDILGMMLMEQESEAQPLTNRELMVS